MSSILITGCNRGIGFALIKNLVQKSNNSTQLIATCRNINKAEELRKLQEANSNVHILELDLNKFENYQDFSKNVERIVQDKGLNVLINNAGISTKFTRLNLVKVDQLVDSLTTNTVAPIILTKTLLPLLQKAAKIDPANNKSKIINMSSILGSISLNDAGGFYPYRCAKTALNAATKSMSVDLKSDGIIAVSLHPGWVKTDMGGKNAPLEVDTSAQGIINIMETITEKDSGKFLQYDGKTLAW
ncbi:C-factor [Chrysoperla carnea]|uniref:C-factor n=1 Tax=Chrysoperla carnea TaxID=189513 RepID=UPI001D075E35|nr:C-factor [Chrysoperla carnea]